MKYFLKAHSYFCTTPFSRYFDAGLLIYCYNWRNISENARVWVDFSSTQGYDSRLFLALILDQNKEQSLVWM